MVQVPPAPPLPLPLLLPSTPGRWEAPEAMAGLQAAVADFQLEYGLFNLTRITQLASMLHHFNQPAHLQKVQVSRSRSARMMV